MRAALSMLALAAMAAPAAAVVAPWPGVATSQLNISVTPSFLASGIVTFNMAVQQTFATDSVKFVFHGPSATPSSPLWTSWFDAHPGTSANPCATTATLDVAGTYAAGGVPAITTGSYDLDSFCTGGAACPGSLVQQCGFAKSPGVLDVNNLRYYGKIEVWLFNAAHADGLLVGFYDAAVELPLNAAAVAGDSLPITVTLNTNLVTVNTPVTGLGLLKSYLMICPNQDVPQQVGGNTVGTLTDASLVTDIYVGETYCLQHVVPALPSGVRLTAHSLFSNGTEVAMVPAFQGADAYNNFTSGNPTYGSVVQFYYTFVDQGLSTFTSTVNFTAIASGSRTSGVPLQPLPGLISVSLQLTLPAAASRAGTALRTSAEARATGATGAVRGLLQAAGGNYAQASALALFQPVAKTNVTSANVTTTGASPPPASGWPSF